MVGVVSARYIANGTTLRVRRASASASLTELGRFLGVKYYQFSFLDLFGSQRSKLVPVSYADDIARSGAGFAGFACNLRMAPTDGDLLAIPDPLSVTVLPWNKDVAWMACNLEWRGTVLDHGPRNVLRLVLGLLRDRGLTMKTGVECEFFLLDKEGSSLADALDTADKPCYEAHTLMRRFDVVSELVDAMESLGWGVYQADHEDANGQFEINWHYADALVTADRVTFFKYMVRSIAEKHGLRATFMPKPFANLTGSGCHCHISVHDATEPAAPNVFKSGERLGFNPSGESFGLNRRALSFLGGLLAEAQALAAVANPTINSYKRIHASTTTSGATWSPNTICWGGNNRTVMVRVPDSPRLELRLADMAANPYLLPAAVAAAGMHGMDKLIEPPEPANCNMYDPLCDEAAAVRRNSPKLPRTLRHAVAEFEASKVFREYLGSATVEAYVELKLRHCDEFDLYLSPWEREQYLDS